MMGALQRVFEGFFQNNFLPEKIRQQYLKGSQYRCLYEANRALAINVKTQYSKWQQLCQDRRHAHWQILIPKSKISYTAYKKGGWGEGGGGKKFLQRLKTKSTYEHPFIQIQVLLRRN